METKTAETKTSAAEATAADAPAAEAIGRQDTAAQSRWSATQRYVLGVFLSVYVINFVDRQIIAILSPAIKADLGLSDTQLGFLKGFAFALFYATLGVPIARLADRRNRVNIVAGAVALWSAMTALCGAAGNFWQLAAARIGVGVGEAGASPPIHSLISDYFAKADRGRAMSIYAVGVPIGMVFGILAGGWLTATVGWRWAFALIGLPGIALAAVVKLSVKEPVRGGTDDPSVDHGADDLSAIDAMKALWERETFRRLAYGGSIFAFTGYAMSMWVVDFIFRAHNLTYADVTVQLALALGVGGAVGNGMAGRFADYVSKTNPDGYVVAPAYAFAASVPFLVLVLTASTPLLCFVALFFFFALSGMYYGPFFALLQNVAPLRARATASALYLFILNAIGFGFGPLYIGVASDALEASLGEAAALRWALLSLAPISLLSAPILLWKRRGGDMR